MPASKSRQRVADLAAQFMQEQGLRDFQLAKQKACQALGLDDQPSNAEISAALTTRQCIFAADSNSELLTLAQHAAKQASQFLHAFNPNLADNLLQEQFTANDYVTLHCCADHVDDIAMLFMAHGIDYELRDKRYRVIRSRCHDDYLELPTLNTHADGVDLTIIVFTPKQWHVKLISKRNGEIVERVKLN